MINDKKNNYINILKNKTQTIKIYYKLILNLPN